MSPINSIHPAPVVRSPVRLPRATHFVFTQVLQIAWLLGAVAGLYGAAVLWLRTRVDWDPGLPLEAILSFAVGLMMSVRVGRAYDRWWEARTQWGKLVNVSRKLAIKWAQYAQLDHDERIEAHRLIQGFPRSLKNHLRGGAAVQTVRGFESEPGDPVHVPAYLSAQIYAALDQQQRSGRFTEIQFLQLDAEARELLEVSGACERIKNTLMPPSLRAFIRFAMSLLLLSMPWELADGIGWQTIPAMVLATFLVVGGESMAHHMEHPFGIFYDDLDLEGYCNGIDSVTAELLGVPDRVDHPGI